MEIQLQPPRWNRSSSNTEQRLPFSKACPPSNQAAPGQRQKLRPSKLRGRGKGLCDRLLRTERLTTSGAGAQSLELAASGKRQSRTRIAGNPAGCKGVLSKAAASNLSRLKRLHSAR